MGTETTGSHYICEFNNCSPELLNSQEHLEKVLKAAAEKAGATVLGSHFHRFEPIGITGLLCLSESHLSIHTWPEHGYAAVDMYTCGEHAHPRKAMAFLQEQLQAKSISIIAVDRGVAFGNGQYKSKIVENDIAIPAVPTAAPMSRKKPEGTTTEWIDEFWNNAEGHLFAVEKVIFSQKSEYQDIKIIENPGYGKVLIIDSNTQSSQLDEHIYHESLVHPTLLIHPNPKNILILGGGEGACLREVLKHRSVEKVTMIDIDRVLVEACKTHLPQWSQGAFLDPRVNVVFADGQDWIEHTKQHFDVIMLDLTDLTADDTSCTPFLSEEFLSVVKSRLNTGGIMLMQSGEISDCDDFTHLSVRKTLGQIFEHTSSYAQFVPSFFGQWSFLMASDKPIVLPGSAEEVNTLIRKRLHTANRFYEGDTHMRMMSLEPVLKRRLQETGIVVTESEKFWTEYRKEKAAFRLRPEAMAA